jgi:hypothetical protein
VQIECLWSSERLTYYRREAIAHFEAAVHSRLRKSLASRKSYRPKSTKGRKIFAVTITGLLSDGKSFGRHP